MPPRIVDNLDLGASYGADEVRKVVAMAGVRQRNVVDTGVTAADLCFEAAERLIADLGWERQSITGLIMVTQSPDYFLPSTCCLIHKWMGLSDECAAFDIGLGCSGYPYGLFAAASMIRNGGPQRVLMLHGETPSLFASPEDHATTLLFGDAGSATALETAEGADRGVFCLRTDGKGYDGLIIRAGGFRERQAANSRDLFVRMDGAGIFNFTISRVPPLIRDTLELADLQVTDVDWYLFHQSNRFIMKHLIKKCGLPAERVPLVIEQYGNSGGPSVALALTEGLPRSPRDRTIRVMMLGYGVGLSWGSALVELDPVARLSHMVYSGDVQRQ